MHATRNAQDRAIIPIEDLAERIHRLAFGRIRHLKVSRSDGLLILEGEATTYHAKQLAQEAVLDLIDGRPALANRIEVR